MQKNSLQVFKSDESGAVTIDWIVLTASAIIGVYLAYSPLVSEIERGGDNIAYVVSFGEMPSEPSGSSMPQTMN